MPHIQESRAGYGERAQQQALPQAGAGRAAPDLPSRARCSGLSTSRDDICNFAAMLGWQKGTGLISPCSAKRSILHLQQAGVDITPR